MSELKTDAKRVGWSRRYEAAMRRFLRQGESGTLRSATRVGRQAVTLGLETLDVVRVHEQALNTMAPPEGSPRSSERELINRADSFFKEAIVPIEATHRAARQADANIDRLTRTLRRRASESSASDAQLKQAIVRRAAEAGADGRAVRDDKLLTEAQRTQKLLRDRLRGILSEQEGGRKWIGSELCDEIAQALLAIDLSLLALATSVQIDMEKTEKSIDDAREILLKLKCQGNLSAQPEDRA